MKLYVNIILCKNLIDHFETKFKKQLTVQRNVKLRLDKVGGSMHVAEKYLRKVGKEVRDFVNNYELPKPKVALFCDFANLIVHPNENLQLNVDYLKFLYLTHGIAEKYGPVSIANLYLPWGPFRTNNDNKYFSIKQREEIEEFAKAIGFKTHQIPPVSGKDQTDSRALVDSVSAFYTNDSISTFIFAAGDNVYKDAISKMKKKGKRIIVFSWEGNTHKSLINLSEILYIDQFSKLFTNEIIPPIEDTSNEYLQSLSETFKIFDEEQKIKKTNGSTKIPRDAFIRRIKGRIPSILPTLNRAAYFVDYGIQKGLFRAMQDDILIDENYPDLKDLREMLL